MQFDRQITITTGASRNDLNWKPQLMTVAELYDRLRNPVRSTETLDAYMHLPKPQQDALLMARNSKSMSSAASALLTFWTSTPSAPKTETSSAS